MNQISTRQHLVPGFLDLSEDEITQRRTRLDPWTIFTALVLIAGSVALVLAIRG